MSKDYYMTRIGGRTQRDIPDIKGVCHICLLSVDDHCNNGECPVNYNEDEEDR